MGYGGCRGPSPPKGGRDTRSPISRRELAWRRLRGVVAHAMALPAMKPKRYGDLNALVVETPGPEEGLAPCVVLLHGFGAPGTDLVPLAEQIAGPPGTRYVFPQAPHAIDTGMPAPFEGRAWWHIDMAELQVALFTRQFDRLAHAHPAGLDEARAQLEAFLVEMVGDLEVPEGGLVIGGFSQGAMLTCDLALRTDIPLAGLVQLSGTTICQDEWQALMPRRRGLPVFQSHAPDDPVLPFALAERLHDSFVRAGAAARFVEFVGGHGIGGVALRGLGEFLGQVLKGCSSQQKMLLGRTPRAE